MKSFLSSLRKLDRTQANLHSHQNSKLVDLHLARTTPRWKEWQKRLNLVLLCSSVWGGTVLLDAPVAQAATTTLSFDQLPTLVSGTDLTQGAVYRFPSVATGIDAMVQVETIQDAQLTILDSNSIFPDRFQPRIAPAATARTNATSYVKFNFKLTPSSTASGTSFATAPAATATNVYFSAQDIDGNSGTDTIREFVEVSGALTSYIANPTLLQPSTPIAGGTGYEVANSSSAQNGLGTDDRYEVYSFLGASASTFSIIGGNKTGSGSCAVLIGTTLDTTSCERLNSWSFNVADIQKLDFGDAPLVFGNAFHPVPPSPTVRLGASVTGDDGPSYTAAADGDGGDDGIATFPPLRSASTSYSLNLTCAGTNASVAGWIDFNKNNTFDPGERAAGTCNGTAVTLNWTGLSGLTTGNTYARFRISSTAGEVTNPTGQAFDGEVEDYQVSIEDIDYGEAPSSISNNLQSPNSYKTTQAEDGARHIVTGSFLGATRTSEADGVPVTFGSDITTSDNDGVVFNNNSPAANLINADVTGSRTNNATITASGAGFLNAWVDYNQNGLFETEEQIFTNQAVVAGSNSLAFTTPSTTIPGATYARFRFTSASVSSPSPSGLLPDGEVEDYRVLVAKQAQGPTCSAGNFTALSFRWFERIGTDPLAAQTEHNIRRVGTLPDGTLIDVNVTASSLTLFDQRGNTAARTPLLPPRGGTLSLRKFAANSQSNTQFFFKFYRSGTTIPVAGNFVMLFGDIDGNDSGSPQNPGLPTSARAERIAWKDSQVSAFELDNTPWVQNVTTPTPAGTVLTGYDREFGGLYNNTFSANDADRKTIRLFLNNQSTFDFNYYSGGFNALDVNPLGVNTATPSCTSPVDYSDAPTSGTAPNGTSPNNYGNATHTVVNTLKLGALIDSETPPITDATASGDGKDDDGITSFPTLNAGATSYSIPVANIIATGTGTLHAWIDFDKNGTFDAGEHTSVAVTSNTPAGALNWTGITAGTTGNTFARFRFTSDSSVTAFTPSGFASDGEVEDYQVSIAPSKAKVLLVKRITAIKPVGATTATNYNTFDITSPLTGNDRHCNWPLTTNFAGACTNNYILGKIDGGLVKPGDEIEYTIYYLNAGGNKAKQARICDQLDNNLTFKDDTSTTPATTAPLDLQFFPGGGSLQPLTNLTGDDNGQLTTPTLAGSTCNLIVTSTNLSNNVVVVDVGTETIPVMGSTGAGIPTTSYGYIRFKTTVKND